LLRNAASLLRLCFLYGGLRLHLLPPHQQHSGMLRQFGTLENPVQGQGQPVIAHSQEQPLIHWVEGCFLLPRAILLPVGQISDPAREGGGRIRILPNGHRAGIDLLLFWRHLKKEMV
jgi:hypothetical protein